MVAMRQVSVRDRHTLCVTFLLASVAMVRRSQDWMDSLSDAAEMAERAMIRPPSPQVAFAYGAGGAVEVHAGHCTAYGVLADGLSSVLPLAAVVQEVPAVAVEALLEVDAHVRTAKKRRRKELLAFKWYCSYCKHYTERAVEGMPVLKCLVRGWYWQACQERCERPLPVAWRGDGAHNKSKGK